MAVIYRSGPKAVKNVFSLAAMFLSSISLMHFVVPKAGRYLFEVMIAEVENLGYQRIPKDTKGWNMWWRHYQYQLQTRHIFSINYKHGKHQEWFSFFEMKLESCEVTMTTKKEGFRERCRLIWLMWFLRQGDERSSCCDTVFVPTCSAWTLIPKANWYDVHLGKST